MSAQSPKPRGGVMSESPVPALTLFGEFVSHAVVPPPAGAASGGRADGPARPARARVVATRPGPYDVAQAFRPARQG